MAEEEEAMWRRLLVVDILQHTWLRLTGMLLANSSANTAEIASFWSYVNGTLAGGETITGISADAGRGRLPDGDGERALDVDDCGLPRPVTLAITFMALEAVQMQCAHTVHLCLVVDP